MISSDLQADARASAHLRAVDEGLPPLAAQLVGGDSPDTLTGGAGDDSLSGGAGDDLLSGGGGGNFLDGGLGNDTGSYAAASEGVTASLATSSGRGGADVLLGLEALVGSAFADQLTGNTLANTLTGGAGQDTLAGGDGADLFVFGLDHTSPAAPDVILDWSAEDRMTFFGAGPGPYQETSAPDAGHTYANSLIAAGARYVTVETPAGVILYVDTDGHGTADEAALLSGRTLADISATNVGSIETLPTAPMGPSEPSAPPPAPPPIALPVPTPPTFPPPPSEDFSSTSVVGDMWGSIDTARISSLLDQPIQIATTTRLRIGVDPATGGAPYLDLVGTGFLCDSNDQLLAGTVTEIIYLDPGGFSTRVKLPGVSAVDFGRWVATDASQEAFATILSGNDRLSGLYGGELLRGFGGDDRLTSGGGASIFGGLGDDVIYARTPLLSLTPQASNYLRGEEGDDYIAGSEVFDDLNGNMGNDTGAGGGGDDWVVGGKDNDLLFGNTGADLVYGNLGNDTCVGGSGNDIVRGGQNDDFVFGEEGDDYVSGDKGDDTVTGGVGADLFHTFGDAGLDRVTDFSTAEGDRVLLAPGTQYTVAQSGADTVISMTGGGQMILVGVQLSSLPDGWIFGA